QKERFFQEARAASVLNHPNITTIHEIDEHYEQIFIAMELLEGKTLKELIKAEPLSIKKVLDIAIQVCDGLTAAAEKQVVHRDIKSDNIILTPKMQVKIMDFGLAKLKGDVKLTKTGSTVGTAAYMSPEQATGEEVDHRSDIFSFGVVLYELLTNHLPFRGEHPSGYIYSILNEEPPPLARFNDKVTPELQRIASKALQKDKQERYQHIDELAADLRHERKNLEYAKSTTLPKAEAVHKPKQKMLKILVPTSMAIILAALFLVFNPFKVEVSRQQTAAAENSLAVMYFDNVADPEDKDRIIQMITALLITDLSESQYMQVVSRQRLYDILKLLGKEDLKSIDKSVASEVAQKAGVKWVLTGSILQTTPNMVVVADISEAASGKVKATQRITGEAGQDIFAVVDRLSAEIKKDLTLPAQAAQEPDRPVANVTTHSPEAYRYYLEGVDQNDKLYWPEAEKSFRKALDFDSTFAMAYYQLAFCLDRQDKPEAKTAITQAVKYSGKVGQLEKHYIKSEEARLSGNFPLAIRELEKITVDFPQEKEAFFQIGTLYSRRLGQHEKAIGPLIKTIEIDPLYKGAYNVLAYAYNDLGDFEKSIWAINKYISLAPEEANPYDTRGDLYGYNGKIDEAVASYRKALEKKPDFYWSLIKLGYMHLFKRDYPRAESCFQALAASGEKGIRSEGRAHLAQIPAYQGKFNEALRVLEQGIAADQFERAEEWPLGAKHLLKADIYVEKKNLALAVEEVKKCMENFRKSQPRNISYLREFYVLILAEKGEIVRAEEVARTLKKDIEKKDTTRMGNYWMAAGGIERAKKNLPAAIAHFEKAARATKEFPEHYLLAKTYLEAGRLGEAVSEFEKILLRYDESRTFELIWVVKAYYLLGLAYEKSGWNQKAIEKYQEFLEIWKNADPGIAEVADAKVRLAKLKQTASK
ncbi:MAG: protein kinase, partial [candidate division Zixibacteria bacterium]|nr:protein kinase [candidate division Zixibacteria bacterium]